MSTSFGRYGPKHPLLGLAGAALVRPLAGRAFRTASVEQRRGPVAQDLAGSLRRRIERGEPAYLLGVTPAGQNSGASLVRVEDGRVELICNEEEERYTGVKYYNGYPGNAIAAVAARLEGMGLRAEDLHGCFFSWDYAELAAHFVRVSLEEFPGPLAAESPDEMGPRHLAIAARAPRRIARQLGLSEPLPTVAMRHHDCHAYLSWALSPFARWRDRVLVSVIDGYGDDASVSLYFAERGNLRLMYRNDLMDSLGMYYGVLSSTQGGWPPMHSDGRYMGAAAWGNRSRETNPYYRTLREILHFGGEGEVRLNRELANWHRGSLARPYTAELTALLGPPIPEDEQWNPDAVIDVERIKHAEITQERVDKAAAVQLVFEDAVEHIIAAALVRTRATALVMTGGTALNCVANSRLLEIFDEQWFERYMRRDDTRLHLWVPPVPGDAGTPAGAAFAFAIKYGKASPGDPLRHAFYCGEPPRTAEIDRVLGSSDEFASMPLGNLNEGHTERVASLAAFLVARDGIVGMYQGVAETGPRALGHRSILANARNPDTRKAINARVKYREWIRPLAPMATEDAAHRYFELSPGAADAGFNAYNYMVLTARARAEADEDVPAVIHRDGTCRLQIVREETDPLSFAFLKALGRESGVEVSVNTSLNVGSAIAHTPSQALETLRRAKGMDGLIMAGDDGQTRFVWHKSRRPHEAAERLGQWLEANGSGGAREPDEMMAGEGASRGRT